MILKDLKKGDLFAFKPVVKSDSQIWIRGDYCRELKKYSVINYADTCRERFVVGSKLVFNDFDVNYEVFE